MLVPLQAQGGVERAEAACTEAEAAEVAADTAKYDLDKARAALAAVDTALAASSSSLLNDKLASAREEADQVVKACPLPLLLACMADTLMHVFPTSHCFRSIRTETRGVEGKYACRSGLRPI